jgi:Rha family phage regulatory protein
MNLFNKLRLPPLRESRRLFAYQQNLKEDSVMNELIIIKRGKAAYIDSREAAEIIGKRHKDLLRDIRKYGEIIGRITGRTFTPSDFFVESAYFDPTGRALPCYLITNRGADVIANKLTGERGVLFTAAYVTKFHEMTEREHANELAEVKAKAVTPQLQAFNRAVKTVLKEYACGNATHEEIIAFLRDAYRPFGIAVQSYEGKYHWTATDIAAVLKVLSDSGRPHSHAIGAIIEKQRIADEHIAVVPYGMVGVTFRYDDYVLGAVADWLIDNELPYHIPHLYFEYHIHYGASESSETDDQASLFDDAPIDLDNE